MNTPMIFKGTAPALVTPFTPAGEIDEAAFQQLIDDQIAGGVAALVVLGTTGENPTISHTERRRLIDLTIDHTAKRVPVIVGTGTYNTSESITFSKEAAAAGADGLLVVGPYYNKPTPAGYKAHFEAIAAATDCPIIVYNVPGRTASNITADLLLEIAALPTVVGVKEASGDLAQIADVLRNRPEGFAVYAGDDEIAFPCIALGAEGVISVISNACPQPFAHMIQLALAGNFTAAKSAHLAMIPAMRACFLESNPAPVKTVLAAAGKMHPTVRLPLVQMNQTSAAAVLSAFTPFIGQVSV